MPWVRQGDCPPERCQGRCCRHIGLWLHEDPAIAAEEGRMMQTRGVAVKEVRFGDTTRLIADLPQVCQYLTEDGLCALFGQPQRPDFCERWPEHPTHLVLQDDCGFSFVWEEEPEKEIAHG